jgi:hypothetical protein
VDGAPRPFCRGCTAIKAYSQYAFRSVLFGPNSKVRRSIRTIRYGTLCTKCASHNPAGVPFPIGRGFPHVVRLRKYRAERTFLHLLVRTIAGADVKLQMLLRRTWNELSWMGYLISRLVVAGSQISPTSLVSLPDGPRALNLAPKSVLAFSLLEWGVFQGRTWGTKTVRG